MVCEFMNDGAHLYMRRFEQSVAIPEFVWKRFKLADEICTPSAKKITTVNIVGNEVLQFQNLGHLERKVILCLDFSPNSERKSVTVNQLTLVIYPWHSVRIELESKFVVESLVCTNWKVC
jgi:hypothetical protein